MSKWSDIVSDGGMDPRNKPEIKIPQDVEEFIAEKQTMLPGTNFGMVMCEDLRAWMTGHVRVPVEPTETMIVAFTDPFIAVNGDNRSAFHQAYKAMLNASKGE